MALLKTEKKWILLYLFFSLGLTLLRLLSPALISQFFDSADTAQVSYLLRIVAVILAASVAVSILDVVCSMLDVRVKNKIVLKAQNDYLSRLLKMDYESLEKIEYGDKKNRYDMNTVYGELAISFVANTVIEIFTCVFICGYLFYLNSVMTLVLILCLFINSVLEYQIGKKSYKYASEVAGIQAKRESKVAEVLKNIPYIKTNDCGQTAVERVQDIQIKLAEKEILHTKEIVAIENLNTQIYKVIEVIIFAVAAVMLKNNAITVGAIYLFINYMGWIDNAFSTIWNNYIKFKSAKARIDTIEKTFLTEEGAVMKNAGDSENEAEADMGGWIEDSPVESFVVENVAYQYSQGDFGIRSVHMELHRGDFVAVIGESGSGKSTLMKILSGLYYPTEGKILYNDMDITNISPEGRSKNISYVSQNIAIMDGNIYDIVDFAGQGCSEDKINEAIERAVLTEVIRELPDGMNTYIGESGVNLSGGQMQRLALAQSVVRNKEICVFDEITSGLDEMTQSRIIENLQELSKDKIMIFVTHRLNTLNAFNRVFEMKAGRLTEIIM